MKIKKYLFLLPAFTLSGCFQRKNEKEEKYEELPTVQIEHDYSEIKDYELSWESLFDPEDNEYFVYFYSTTCNHCSELKNYIIEKALLMKNIYFVKGDYYEYSRIDIFA